ncbi:hypothetical protein Hypma_007791 [Hypsizygus marmoreus]|uniref:peptidylprolyl isomerase n=1 Tax=Hypsizygus marmoreus TaxID=39966 RepID=A0A369K1I6_HYPMA|nr:hypothetical protein Hypma_007791 [Hypsizygus marmoreus]
MAIAIGLWSLELKPGKVESVEPQADIRITNVALGDVLKDASGRTTVKLTYQGPVQIDSEDEDEDQEDEPKVSLHTTVVCSLKPDTFEQTSTDIVLQEDEEYVFEVVGKNTVYLTGNYIEQSVNNPPYMGSEDGMDSDDDEDAYDLREVSSDVEMNPDELMSHASHLDEIEEHPKNLKRARDLEAEEPAKLSKAEKKKKQKGENGKPVESTSETKKAESKKEEPKGSSEGKKSKAVEKEVAGGIKVLDSKVGTGPTAKKGNTVRMRYIGKLTTGKVFDKNVKGKPFTFHLGKGEVIKGWDEGIVGMQVGGERRLTIPPAMGYGKSGTDGIPKNATLIFEVKLMEIK